MVFDRWQAPDRDSPTTAEFTATVELGQQLDLLLQMEGHAGTKEDEVAEVTGVTLSRPRRWHKIFERMGLLYQDPSGKTRLTDLGRHLVELKRTAGREFRRSLARLAVTVLRKYQLKNPADESEDGYPEGADLHPYWAIWRAAVELDGRLHWDEVNRELMWVLRHGELDQAIEKIRLARAEPDYSPVGGGSKRIRLRDRCYDQTSAPAGKDPDGQVRDQKTTPWFKRAGFGELLLEPPGAGGEGYWTVAADIADILRSEVASPPSFRAFAAKEDWFEYYGRLEAVVPAAAGETATEERWIRLLMERQNVVFFGPPGTGKTHAAFSVKAEWARRFGDDSVFPVTFHPSYGYEDFVQGFRPSQETTGVFELQPGILLLASDRAESFLSSGRKVLLLIDEINRGDVSRIFGELITYIEPDRRGQPFFLAQTPSSTRTIPPNLYLLGTMNTADKSISLLDVALRRRFAFVEFPPDSAAFGRISEWRSEVGGISLGRLLDVLNQRLADSGIEPDRALGHALLRVAADSPDPVEALERRFLLDVIPLILEYCYLDRGRVSRILSGLVDQAGRLIRRSPDDFIGALASLTSPEPAVNRIPAVSPLPPGVAAPTGGTDPSGEHQPEG